MSNTQKKVVRCGLIQCSNPLNDETRPVAEIVIGNRLPASGTGP